MKKRLTSSRCVLRTLRKIAASAIFAAGLTGGTNSYAIVIDSFDQTFQSHTTGGVAQSSVLAAEADGGVRNLLAVSSTTTVSGTSPGIWSASGSRADTAYGTALPFLNRPIAPGGVTSINQDWTGFTRFEIDFDSASGITSLQIEALGDGNSFSASWLTIAVADSASPFTLAVDFADFSSLGGTTPDLNSVLNDVDGLLFRLDSSSTMNFQISEIRVAGSAIPEPGTLAIFGIGIVGFAATRRRKQPA